MVSWRTSGVERPARLAWQWSHTPGVNVSLANLAFSAGRVSDRRVLAGKPLVGPLTRVQSQNCPYFLGGHLEPVRLGRFGLAC